LTLILICLYAVIHLLRCVDYTAFSHAQKQQCLTDAAKEQEDNGDLL
jgi:hypothetical protein